MHLTNPIEVNNLIQHFCILWGETHPTEKSRCSLISCHRCTNWGHTAAWCSAPLMCAQCASKPRSNQMYWPLQLYPHYHLLLPVQGRPPRILSQMPHANQGPGQTRWNQPSRRSSLPYHMNLTNNNKHLDCSTLKIYQCNGHHDLAVHHSLLNSPEMEQYDMLMIQEPYSLFIDNSHYISTT